MDAQILCLMAELVNFGLTTISLNLGWFHLIFLSSVVLCFGGDALIHCGIYGYDIPTKKTFWGYNLCNAVFEL